MDLRQLRYFVEIAKCGSFNNAAGKLRVSQSSLSRRVLDLEEELGTQLLIRHSRGVSLTDAGSVMLQRANSLLDDAAAAREEVMAQSSIPAGEVTIGMSSTFSRNLLGAVVEPFHDDFPRLRLRFVEGAQFALYEGLGAGRIDLAVMISPDPMTNYIIEPLLIERLNLVSSLNHAIDADELSVTDLVGLPFVMFPRPTGIRNVLDQATGEAGINLDVRYELADVVAQLDFVHRGLAYGILSKSAIRDNKAHRSVNAAPIQGLTLTRALVSRAERNRSPAVVVVANRIREVLRGIADTEQEQSIHLANPV